MVGAQLGGKGARDMPVGSLKGEIALRSQTDEVQLILAAMRRKARRRVN
jgi:hypothetical protein